MAKTDFSKGEIDEDLFGGFLSAITSFKSEMKSKVPTIHDEGKTPRHEILSQGFNITAFDGDFLRLAVVSDNKLEKMMRERMVESLFSYENLHRDDLKYFKGKLKPFKDFREFIIKNLDLAFNILSVVEESALQNIDVPETVKDILIRLAKKQERFYPAQLPRLIANKANLSDIDAIYYAYTAFQQGAFQKAQPKPEIKKSDLGINIDESSKMQAIKKLQGYLQDLADFKRQNDEALESGRITEEKYSKNAQIIRKKMEKAQTKLNKLKNN